VTWPKMWAGMGRDPSIVWYETFNFRLGLLMSAAMSVFCA